MKLEKLQREELITLALNLESHLKRLWIVDVFVVVALLVGAMAAWESDWYVRAILAQGAAFYYCGKGDGERRVAKRALNFIDGYGFEAKDLDGKAGLEDSIRDKARGVS